MECKGKGILFMHFTSLNWNISRMECKEFSSTTVKTGDVNWNISRMECKDIRLLNPKIMILIGIYPEWNVKLLQSLPYQMERQHWNISRMECKETTINHFRLVKFDWNISRMECKVLL